ncbi:unnamed protein product [Allacma fusca]|uniref:Uncharacterized protein n=1 Tax=Allacma fusca TaxID=39272 RepID=A0A8J2J7G8_9HEXA|nr:unnamed protein product [Allacma fusca]
MFLATGCSGAPLSDSTLTIENIILFEHKNYLGNMIVSTLPSEPERCLSVGGISMKEKITSVKFMVGCVQLCKDEGCSECITLRENTTQLDPSFNDQVQRMKMCVQGV